MKSLVRDLVEEINAVDLPPLPPPPRFRYIQQSYGLRIHLKSTGIISLFTLAKKKNSFYE